MLTAIDVLNHIKSTYPTFGVLQRQKLLYYSQAWALTWFGKPLFGDPVTAFEKGPVVEAAWRADKGSVGVVAPGERAALTHDERSIVGSVFAFYGRLSGADLIVLTHSEDPWIDSYENASLFGRGRQEITHVDMVRFYTAKVMRHEPTPAKPITSGEDRGAWDLRRELSVEVDRFATMLEILADK